MTDREKLIELIGKCRTYLWGKEVPDVPTEDKLIADHLIAHGVVVREKGEWEMVGENSTGKIFLCPVCKFPHNPNKRDVGLARAFERPYFCPNCGADMRKGENG